MSGTFSTGGSLSHGGSIGQGGSIGEGLVCGGIIGRFGCMDDGLFCSYSPESRCGTSGRTGLCELLPEGCDDIFEPVCGCDGNTYGNRCYAALAGVSAASDGECPERAKCSGETCRAYEFCQYTPEAQCGNADPPGQCKPIPEACGADFPTVCGCDGKTYSNVCTAAAAGVAVSLEGNCSPRACSTFADGTCAADEYCALAPEDQCGRGDTMGVCAQVPKDCGQELNPVCGCNAVSYANACLAAKAGVSVEYIGRCSATRPGVDCGGSTTTACDGALYCSYSSEAQCGSNNRIGTCTIKPRTCNVPNELVCGCDGQTYTSACVAASQGVSVAVLGACE